MEPRWSCEVTWSWARISYQQHGVLIDVFQVGFGGGGIVSLLASLTRDIYNFGDRRVDNVPCYCT